MQHLLHSFYGFVLLAGGVALPGLVNMTTVRVCLNRGYRAAMRFNAGAAVAVLLHAYIALAFAGLLNRNPSVILYLRQLAALLFLVLGFVFFYQGIRREAAKASHRKGRPMVLGFLVSAANVVNIPAIFAFSTYLRMRGQLLITAPYRFLFALGAALGAFAMLGTYAFFAKKVESGGPEMTQRLNYFLSGLFFVLALVQGVQLYWA